MELIERLLTLVFGVLIGSLTTSQRAAYKSRQTDAHVLKLAYQEVCDFEGSLHALEAVGPDAVSRLSNESLGSFLKTELALLLPSEVRAELKAVWMWINGFNEALAASPEKLSEFSNGSDVMQLEFPKLLALNSIAYTDGWKYWLFGWRSSPEAILKKMASRDVHDLEVKHGLD